MAYSFILLNNRFVSLRIIMNDGGLATIVQQELGLVEVFLVACDQVEFGECHLCNLMTRDDAGLSGVRTNFFTYDVGIADGDVEELTAAGGLIVCDGSLDHVAEVVEFVAQVFLLAPAGIASPLMGLFRVLGARSVKITVRFLSRGDYLKHTVYICHQFLIRIGL